MKNYYFFNSDSNFFLGTTDLRAAEKELGINCIYNRYTNLKSFFLALNRIHTSIQINQIINLPFKKIWKKYDELDKIAPNNVLIETDSSIKKLTLNDLENLKKKNISVYMLFLNTASTNAASYALQLTKLYTFKCIYTVDFFDAQKYGFVYTNQVYFKTDIKKLPIIKEHPKLFFVGNSKGRLDVLLKINSLINETLFYISSVSKKEIVPQKGIIYNRYIEYNEVLAFVLNSNCILEIVQEGQHGLTFRDYEAICYNRKLLTNNSAIFSLKEYNPNYISYFTDINDIDTRFVTKEDDVNFKYDNSYSPKYLIQKIIHFEEVESIE